MPLKQEHVELYRQRMLDEGTEAALAIAESANFGDPGAGHPQERELFIDNLLVRIH